MDNLRVDGRLWHALRLVHVDFKNQKRTPNLSAKVPGGDAS
jgi:hypothetical protein